MELRQLEHFVAVAEERHFTRAARRVHIVQSGLSASIRALERELGAALFARSTRRVELTEEGRALLEEARAVLAAADRARDAVAAVRGLLRGRLSVGVMQRVAGVDLPATLGRFRERHPDVEIRLRQAGATVLADDVRAARLDFAFVAVPAAQLRGVARTPLVAEPMLLACAPGHRLADRRPVRLSALADEDFVEFQQGWGVRIVLDQAFAALGIERRIVCEVNDTPTLLDLVAHGLGVAVVPRVLAAGRGDIAVVDLQDRAPQWEVSLVTREDGGLSAPSRAFLAMLDLPVQPAAPDARPEVEAHSTEG
ncbi:MAG TPA: LysR family transcriptional regulator [Solirubrobacteraceae bacterium]|nr:LysR family transcriptional regulator [Solirubrobacteraceae bacterium]